MKRSISLAVLLLSFPAFGAERASESDMFGSSPSVAGTPSPTPKAGASDNDSQAMGGLAPDAKTRDAKTEDHLQIGGTLSTEADYYLAHDVPLEKNTVSNPNILFLYADSKLDNDARILARIRLFYDPTGVTGSTPGDLSNPYGFGTGTSDNVNVSLQELKLSANIDQKVYFTFGRQKVKFGTAKFFNITDFLNSQPLNFLLPSDERPGIDMVKMHVPFGIANFYAIGLTGTAGTANSPGGYFRGEFAYDGIGDILGAGEISLSGILPRSQGPQTTSDISHAARAGLDLSQSVGDLDLYFEGAAGQVENGDWKMAETVGGTWEIRYADRGSNTVSLQAEYSNAGQTAEYGVFSIYLPEPGTLKDITFVNTNLFSFRYKSGLSRLDIVYNFTPQITGRVYGAGHWAELGKDFYRPGQVAEFGTRLDVNF